MPPLKLKIGDVVWLNKAHNRRRWVEEYLEPYTGPGPFIVMTRGLHTGDSVRVKHSDGRLFKPHKFSRAAEDLTTYPVWVGYLRKDEFLSAVKRSATKPEKQRGPMKQGAD